MIEQPFQNDVSPDRHIQQLPDGSYYSDVITLLYDDTQGARPLAFHIEPDSLYAIIRAGIARMTLTEESTQDAEADLSRIQTSKMMKLAIRGLFIAYGNKLLDIFFGSRDHEKMPKGADVLEWYTDMFTRIGLAYMMKTDIHLKGTVVYDTTEKGVIRVSGVTTQPVPGEDNNRTQPLDADG